jgi:hypothetical protein
MTSYLSPEDYEIARKNGIPKKMAYHRFYFQNWSKERAITEIHRLKKWSNLFDQYKEIAIVSEKTFKSRVLRGWHPQKAATAPHRNNREITKEVIETAAKNGISENSLRNRVSLYKWPIERAMTEPIHEGQRRKSYEKA